MHAASQLHLLHAASQQHLLHAASQLHLLHAASQLQTAPHRQASFVQAEGNDSKSTNRCTGNNLEGNELQESRGGRTLEVQTAVLETVSKETNSSSHEGNEL